MPETPTNPGENKLTWPQSIGLSGLLIGSAVAVKSILEANPSTPIEFLNQVDKIGAGGVLIGGGMLLVSYLRREASAIMDTMNSAIHE